MDTGSIRHWPRIAREELVKIFPNGRTVHIPSDGRPLRGYALALADVERRGGTLGQASMEAAQHAGIVAENKPKRNFLAALFGRSESNEDEEATTTATVSPAKSATRGPTVVSTVFTKPDPAQRNAPAPTAQPAPYKVAAVPVPPSRPARIVPESAVASDPSSASAIVAARGAWDTDGLKQLSETSAITVAAAEALAAVRMPADRMGLAYAADRDFSAVARKPAAFTTTRPKLNEPKTTLAATNSGTAKAQSFDDIWLRAVVLAPDMHNFMSATLLGAPDYRDLRTLMRKPTSALAMTFSSDPMAGMNATRFSGQAIVFLDTVTFVTRTAFLQQ
jgi:hypothetical protein